MELSNSACLVTSSALPKSSLDLESLALPKHREFVKDNISNQNDISFRWRPDSESFDSISIGKRIPF